MLIIIFPLNPFTSINKYNSFAYVNARTETRVRQLNFDRRRRTFVPCRMIRILNRPVIRKQNMGISNEESAKENVDEFNRRSGRRRGVRESMKSKWRKCWMENQAEI